MGAAYNLLHVMSLAPGVRLGPYEIVALIGAGGMGEVYRARDGNLTRDVALKILPELFARDPERRARFAREANLLATLNHPNIAAIYGFESSDHVPALVLEMVEGPTLADRIERGPIPPDEALPIAKQIAQALEAAHAQGIVHRDLKPANVKVRDDGTVKVLDFGLAKAIAADSAPAVVAAAPTITSPAATAMGTIMGTAAYMSPEQARGRVVDTRSDIWSFGAVLYEILTGRRAFDGEDVSDTLANVLKREPDWSALPPDTPPAIERVLRRCLTKDPWLRTHDAADIRIDLDDRGPATQVAAADRSGRLRVFERSAWIGVALAFAALAGFAWWRGRAAEPLPQPVLRFQVPPPDKHSFGALGGPGVGYVAPSALSPDGTRIVFYAEDQTGKGSLWLRALDSFDARQLPETGGGFQPFWSPDSQSIAFFAERKLYRLDVARGERREVCPFTGNPRGGSWSATGSIVFATTNPLSLMRVASQGGKPAPIRLPGAENHLGPISWPSFLPDGRRFLYAARTKEGAVGTIYLASIDSDTDVRRVVTSDTQAAFVAPGYLLFGRDTRLLHQAFDVETGQVSGDAVAVVDRLRMMTQIAFGEFSASNTGMLAYRSGLDASNQFTWVDRKGAPHGTVGAPGRYRTSALSPDGRRLVYTDLTDGNLELLDLRTQITMVLTSEPGSETAPVWSSDGKYVYYRSDNGGVFRKEPDGTSGPVKVLDGLINGPSQFVKDATLGPLLLYFGILPNQTSMDILILPLSGPASPRAIVATPSADVEPQVSPDGKWLAYSSSETGAFEVYVSPFPPADQKGLRISRSGGRQPMWRADSHELFFVNDFRKFYVVRIPESGPAPDIAPEFLFDMHANVANARNSYVPSADGQRFLVNMVLDTEDAPINVISNWPAGIK
jgi:eukaryotic-like serine/threonine-protein kinase